MSLDGAVIIDRALHRPGRIICVAVDGAMLVQWSSFGSAVAQVAGRFDVVAFRASASRSSARRRPMLASPSIAPCAPTAGPPSDAHRG